VTSTELAALRIFFDTSVVLAGAFSRKGASYALLQTAGLGLIAGYISPDVRNEAMRNAQSKVPASIPTLRFFLNEILIEGALPTPDELHLVSAFAAREDVPILACAVVQRCRFLVTLNERDFWPPPSLITALRPGPLMMAIREQITGLES